jgi:hypothetical protein
MPDELTSSEKKQPEEKPVTSAEDFITKSPLFVPIRVDGFHPPPSINFACDGTCSKETTWYRVHEPLTLGDLQKSDNGVVDWSIKSVAYRCFKCGKTSLTVVYRELASESRSVGARPATGLSSRPSSPPSLVKVLVKVMKVGQYPEPTIAIPDALERNLGKDSATLYKRALICRNVGYGLAAAGYIRRVVEDKTNELIEVVAKFAEAHGVDAKKVEEIRAAANSGAEYTRYEDKLKIASAVFPDSLKVGGKNPLFSLFKLVSEGIHGKNEEECVKIAEATDTVFQYVFTNLKAETEIRKTYIEKMKELP